MITIEEYKTLTAKKTRKSKYRNVPIVVDGLRFDSKKEADTYARLKMMIATKDVRFFLRQVPFDLPGGVKYRCDFLVFWTNDEPQIWDVKPWDRKKKAFRLTREYINKKKQVEALYPIKIQEV